VNIIIIMVVLASWTGNVIAAQYDPTVERAQLRLTELGYEAGTADGLMGGNTTVAIKKFQEVNKLAVTGELDENTLQELKIAVPAIKCTKYSCKVENGLTEEMVYQIRQHFAEEKYADELTLQAATYADLKQLPALKEGLVQLKIQQSDFLGDITPLGELTNLEELHLDRLTELTDLTPLGKLTGLKDLRIKELGQPVDIAALADLANLEELSLSSLNKDSEEPFDISVLAGKPHLKDMAFYRVNVNDLSPLQDSIELSRLFMEATKVEDLSPLKAFTKLNDLKLLVIPATDLSPVGELTELTQLGLRKLDVTDLAFLANLSKLRVLTLNDIPATDMSSVGHLTELKNLALFKTQFDDYSPIANCVNMETLTARYKGEGFNNLDVITAMPNLATLYLDGNANIQNWDALATAKNLKSLWVTKTSFSDLGLLKEMAVLQTLGLNECTVTNPEAIAALPELATLHIKKTQGIDDLMIFKDLPKLAKFKVYYDKEQFPQDQIDALKQATQNAK
jgi:internalin A